MSDQSRSRKVAEWNQRLLRFSNSGQSVVEFCRTEGVSQPSFYGWRKKLKAVGVSAKSIGEHDALVRVVTPVRPRNLSRFESVSLDSHSIGAAGLKVRLPGGIELELGDDPSVIETVVKQLVESAIQESAFQESLQKTGPQSC